MFDYIIVGAGLFGAVLANELTDNGKSVLVVERKDHVGGTVYTEKQNDIHVHKYGAHIFRTNDINIWQYINKFSSFRPFINCPIAMYKNTVYNLPFNMNTFSKLWNIRSPDEAKKIIHSQQLKLDRDPENLEEYALSVVGHDIYECFIKHYTEKQWGVTCDKLPADTMKRIPIRYSYNNNYYDALYQGVPYDGYTPIVDKMLSRSTVLLGIDGRQFIQNNAKIAGTIIYTGSIDEYFQYDLGRLNYRSLYFENILLNGVSNFQGNAVVNMTDDSVPYTRSIEHKHFLNENVAGDTVVSREYSIACSDSNEPYYPVRDKENLCLYEKYKQKADEAGIIFAGRLGSFEYTDMTDTIINALNLAKNLIERRK